MNDPKNPAHAPLHPIGVTTPLSHEQIEHQCAQVDGAHLDAAHTAFLKGVRFAERAHGIGAPVHAPSEEEILRAWSDADCADPNPKQRFHALLQEGAIIGDFQAAVVRNTRAVLAHIFRQQLVDLALQQELSEAIDDVTDWLDHEGYAEADIRPSLQRLNSARMQLLVATRRRAIPAGGLTAGEYLTKVQADPQRAAALQRARERIGGANVDDATAGTARKLTFDEWWQDHGQHNAAHDPAHLPTEMERRKELMKLSWDVALADGVKKGGQHE